MLTAEDPNIRGIRLKMYLNYILSTKNFYLSKLRAEISKKVKNNESFKNDFTLLHSNCAPLRVILK